LGKERRNSRRVHFETGGNKDIVQHSIPATARIGDRERRALWWTPQEAGMMNDRTQMIADSYKEDEAYIEKFILLFTMCAQTKEGPLPCTNDAYQLVQTSARGLEVLILSILQRYRARHVEAILNAQDELSDSLDLEEKNQMLSELSQKYSRPAALLAQVLASTDAEFISSAP
jgi:hypothetical protein